MKKFKIIGISSLAIALLGFAGYYYVMFGGARDLSTEEISFKVTSKNISTEFAINIDSANKKYLEKAVAISGKVTDISSPSEVIIDKTIICNLKNSNNSIKMNQIITLKGRVIGYDDLLGELKLDQCFVI